MIRVVFHKFLANRVILSRNFLHFWLWKSSVITLKTILEWFHRLKLIGLKKEQERKKHFYVLCTSCHWGHHLQSCHIFANCQFLGFTHISQLCGGMKPLGALDMCLLRMHTHLCTVVCTFNIANMKQLKKIMRQEWIKNKDNKQTKPRSSKIPDRQFMENSESLCGQCKELIKNKNPAIEYKIYQQRYHVSRDNKGWGRKKRSISANHTGIDHPNCCSKHCHLQKQLWNLHLFKTLWCENGSEFYENYGKFPCKATSTRR